MINSILLICLLSFNFIFCAEGVALVMKKKGNRGISPHGEKRYIALRGGFSRTFYINEVIDQQLLVHLEDEFGNDEYDNARAEIIRTYHNTSNTTTLCRDTPGTTKYLKCL